MKFNLNISAPRYLDPAIMLYTLSRLIDFFLIDVARGQWTSITVSSSSSPELVAVGTLIAACVPVHAWLGLHRCNWVGGFPICITVEDVAALQVTNGTDTNGRDCLPICAPSMFCAEYASIHYSRAGIYLGGVSQRACGGDRRRRGNWGAATAAREWYTLNIHTLP